MKRLITRKNIRLKNYDYSQKGMYFITICTKNRECILSTIQNSSVGASIARPQNEEKSMVGACIARPHEVKILQLTNEGIVVDFFINEIEKIHNNISIREYVIMPNHIHILLEINDKGKTLSKIIQQFKGAVTKKLGYSMWQKLFYEHIVHDEKEYFAIKQYIKNNPNTWEEDWC